MHTSKFSREEKSWILYDVANSAFSLIMLTSVMPLFFQNVASKGLTDTAATANWGYGNSIASLILAIMAPVLGTFSDYPGARKKFFSFFMILGVISTLAMTGVPAGSWVLAIVLFILGRLGFGGGNLFYDAFLPDVTKPKRMDRVSAWGFGWGYIGSTVPFLMIIAFFSFSSLLPDGFSVYQAGFLITGIWWFFFSLPLLKNVNQKHSVEKKEHPVKASFLRLFRVFREIRQYRSVFIFLLAYFFYIDGVDTIIVMAISYGREMGLTGENMIPVLLMIQVVAFPFALLYGKLAERFGTRPMLLTGIGVYLFISVLAFFIPSLENPALKLGLFWALAFLVATSQGGVQSLSRSFFAKLIPENRSGEFFGFYNIFGKFALILGPLLMGLVGNLTGHSRYGVLSLVLLFAAGGALLWKVEPGKN
jgi:UMF1 family MFS transporter